jgi:hypothetical protein
MAKAGFICGLKQPGANNFVNFNRSPDNRAGQIIYVLEFFHFILPRSGWFLLCTTTEVTESLFFLLDWETTIQQKPAVLRAGKKIISSIMLLQKK